LTFAPSYPIKLIFRPRKSQTPKTSESACTSRLTGTRPGRPVLETNSLFSTLKVSPEEWRQMIVPMPTRQHKIEVEPISCHVRYRLKKGIILSFTIFSFLYPALARIPWPKSYHSTYSSAGQWNHYDIFTALSHLNPPRLARNLGPANLLPLFGYIWRGKYSCSSMAASPGETS
jgi:hypothetical protein